MTKEKIKEIITIICNNNQNTLMYELMTKGTIEVCINAIENSNLNFHTQQLVKTILAFYIKLI